jgi:hypothetical protein
MNELVPVRASTTLPALAAAAGDRAGMRFLEFFAANLRNPHTRRAYEPHRNPRLIQDVIIGEIAGRAGGRVPGKICYQE